MGELKDRLQRRSLLDLTSGERVIKSQMRMLQGKISLHLLLPTHTYILCTDEDALISKDSHTPNDFSYFIIDSGASAHMCHDWSYYTSYQKLDHPKCIWIANDRTIDAVGIGDIKIHTVGWPVCFWYHKGCSPSPGTQCIAVVHCQIG